MASFLLSSLRRTRAVPGGVDRRQRRAGADGGDSVRLNGRVQRRQRASFQTISLGPIRHSGTVGGGRRYAFPPYACWVDGGSRARAECKLNQPNFRLPELGNRRRAE